MSKHPMDRRQPSSGEKLRMFLGLDHKREDKPHPASQTLHQRGDTARGDGRLRQFMRIERGQTA